MRLGELNRVIRWGCCLALAAVFASQGIAETKPAHTPSTPPIDDTPTPATPPTHLVQWIDHWIGLTADQKNKVRAAGWELTQSKDASTLAQAQHFLDSINFYAQIEMLERNGVNTGLEFTKSLGIEGKPAVWLQIAFDNRKERMRFPRDLVDRVNSGACDVASETATACLGEYKILADKFEKYWPFYRFAGLSKSDAFRRWAKLMQNLRKGERTSDQAEKDKWNDEAAKHSMQVWSAIPENLRESADAELAKILVVEKQNDIAMFLRGTGLLMKSQGQPDPELKNELAKFVPVLEPSFTRLWPAEMARVQQFQSWRDKAVATTAKEGSEAGYRVQDQESYDAIRQKYPDALQWAARHGMTDVFYTLADKDEKGESISLGVMPIRLASQPKVPVPGEKEAELSAGGAIYQTRNRISDLDRLTRLLREKHIEDNGALVSPRQGAGGSDSELPAKEAPVYAFHWEAPTSAIRQPESVPRRESGSASGTTPITANPAAPSGSVVNPSSPPRFTTSPRQASIGGSLPPQEANAGTESGPVNPPVNPTANPAQPNPAHVANPPGEVANAQAPEEPEAKSEFGFGRRPASFMLAHDMLASPNQMNAGSCLYMASTGIMEWLINKKRAPDDQVDLSERFLLNRDLWRAAQGQQLGVQDSYSDMVNLFKHTGAALDKDMPFQITTRNVWNGRQWVPTYDTQSPNWQRVDDSRVPKYRIPAFSQDKIFSAGPSPYHRNVMSAQTIEAIKQRLWARNAPVLFVYFPYFPRGTPQSSMFWHASVIVGYDDTRGVFITRDSSFGEKLPGTSYRYGTNQGHYAYLGNAEMSYQYAASNGNHATQYFLDSDEADRVAQGRKLGYYR